MVDPEILTQVPAWAQNLTESFGYLGLFLVSFIGSATIIFPIPAFILIFVLGAVMNPWLVGIVSGIGSALGELTGYVFGRGGGKILERRYDESVKKYKKWFNRDNTFLLVVIFAATPLPDDVLGIICGMFDYDWKKFIIAAIIGKSLMSLALAWAGFYGIKWVLTIFGG